MRVPCCTRAGPGATISAGLGARNSSATAMTTTLAEPEPQIGDLITARLDHGGERHNGEGCARAEAGGREAGGKTAPVGKPFQRVADGGAEDRTGAEPGDDRGEVE